MLIITYSSSTNKEYKNDIQMNEVMMVLCICNEYVVYEYLIIITNIFYITKVNNEQHLISYYNTTNRTTRNLFLCLFPFFLYSDG